MKRTLLFVIVLTVALALNQIAAFSNPIGEKGIETISEISQGSDVKEEPQATSELSQGNNNGEPQAVSKSSQGNNEELQTDSNIKEKKLEIVSKTSKGSNKYYNWNINIPQLKGLESGKIQKAINDQIMGDIISFRNEIYKQAKEGYAAAQKSGYPFNPYEAHTTYQVGYLGSNLLSLTVDLYQFTGGAHGGTTRVPYNYDLTTGKPLGYKDLFKKGTDYKKVIVEEIVKSIQENPDIYFPDAVETVRNFTDAQPFYLTEEGIVVIYGQYEIAPYAAGIREFLIPYSLFGNAVIDRIDE